MQFNVGDKVRFLNETGSGIVSAIIDNKNVQVRIEDGLEIPYPVKYLVKSEIPNSKAQQPTISENKKKEMLNNIDPEQLKKAILNKKNPKSGPAKSKPHSVGNREIEIDLHIEELMDNHKGLSNGQIIEIQLKHFRRKLDDAIQNNTVRKITFIHGVGSGKLKHEISHILESIGLRFYDASYSRYGFGATEVILK